MELRNGLYLLIIKIEKQVGLDFFNVAVLFLLILTYCFSCIFYN